MNCKHICTFFIFFGLLLFFSCSSADKKNLPAADFRVSSINNSAEHDFNRNKTTSVKSPADFHVDKPEVISFRNDDIKVTLYAKSFAQGNGVYAEIENMNGGPDLQNVKLSYKKTDIPVTKTSWGFRGLWGIDPEEKPGQAVVKVIYSINGNSGTLESEIFIKDVDYPVSKSMLNVGKFSDKSYTSDPKFKDMIAECAALRKKAFSSVTEDSIGNVLSYPRDMHKITGYYWKKRIYLSYKKVKKKRVKVEGKRSFHRGLDLKGDIGAPVYAMADGLVVLSHTMFYEGNMVVVDHGNQVFSYYQHLDSRNVREGDRVKAGDILGGVGETGMVTGPHLHVAFSIRGVHIDPLSVLSLPVSR